MPTYGKNKIKDMVRSVLPSTARHTAKDNKNRIHREARRTSRQDVAKLVIDPEKYEEFVDDDRTDREETRRVVADRRDADKTSPLRRWAPHVTEGPPDARLKQLRGLVPDNTIGVHAISHVEYLDEFDKDKELREMRYPKPTAASRREYNRKNPDKRSFEDGFRTILLREIVENGLHGRLNAAIQDQHTTWKQEYLDASGSVATRKVGPHGARKLLGMGDIKMFLRVLGECSSRHVVGVGMHHPEWRETLDAYLREYVKQGRDPRKMMDFRIDHLAEGRYWRYGDYTIPLPKPKVVHVIPKVPKAVKRLKRAEKKRKVSVG